jgi:hypothetical protein
VTTYYMNANKLSWFRVIDVNLYSLMTSFTKKLILPTLVFFSIILLSFAPEKSRDIDSPCELVSLEEVKLRFELDESIEISFEDKAYTYPTCSFKWKDGQVTKTMDIGGQKMDVELESELLIVMVKEANESKYEASISVYSDGQIEGGIGELATWSPKRAQLTFLSNSYLFHVHVRASNDNAENRKNAIEIAGGIMGKL